VAWPGYCSRAPVRGAARPAEPSASLAFLTGVTLAITVATLLASWVAGLVEASVGAARTGTVATVIDWLLVVLLVILMMRVVTRRTHRTPPKWMGRLQATETRLSFRLGLLVRGASGLPAGARR
jgi:hypothetical protein